MYALRLEISISAVLLKWLDLMSVVIRWKRKAIVAYDKWNEKFEKYIGKYICISCCVKMYRYVWVTESVADKNLSSQSV